MRPPGRVPPCPHRPVPGGPVRAGEDPRSRLPAASRGLLTGPRAHALLRTARQIKNVSPFPEAEVHAGWTARARRWEVSPNRPARPPAHAQGARPACPAAASAPRDGRSPGTEAATPRCTRIAGGQQEARGARASGRRACAQQSCATLAAVTATPAAARKPGSRGTSLRCSSAKDQGAWLGSSSLNTPRAGHGPPRGSTGDTTTWQTPGKGKDDAQ